MQQTIVVKADMMLCGGSDAVTIPIGLGGFVACRALFERNNDPTKASRPWDMDHDGFVMGEGSDVLLLEELEHAKQRGANFDAYFQGGSFTCDPYHITKPHPEGTGIVLYIEKALTASGVARENVNYVNAHVTSTPAVDLKEYHAPIRCFGNNPELRVNSTKSLAGHLLGVAGAMEAVTVIGKGSGVLLLEELEHAKQRGANIYAEFLGGSFTCDAYHITKPQPEGTGIALCIEKALTTLGVARENFNYVNAPVTWTPAGDLKEYQALIRCFGNNPELRVNSTKSLAGHLLGALVQ